MCIGKDDRKLRQGEIWNLINKIVWSKDKQNFVVVILDRLMPNNERAITGDKIVGTVGRNYIELKDGGIVPLHRVIEIKYKETTIFSRRRVSK